MRSDIDEQIGKAVQRFRSGAGLTQGELADQMSRTLGENVLQQTVARIELGRRPLRLSEAFALSGILNVHMPDLLLSGDQLNDAARLSDRSSAILAAIREAATACEDLQRARVELKYELTRTGANSDSLTVILEVGDPQRVAREAVDTVNREYYGELPPDAVPPVLRPSGDDDADA